MKMNNIKTVIFDLGGVILDLDVNATIRQFSLLSGMSLEEVRELYSTHPVFHQLEKGIVDEEVFRKEVRDLFDSKRVSDERIDDAWNSMLVRVPEARLTLLKELKNQYHVIILSNTNSIHVRHINQVILPQAGAYSLEPFVHRVYFSHELKMRKPDAEIYQHVLSAGSLQPEETVFLDDNGDNIVAAEKLGINIVHITHPDKVFELFKQHG